MPERSILLRLHFIHPTLIIYSDDCTEEIISKAKNCDSELGAVSVLELSQGLIFSQWNILFENRVLKIGIKLVDINKQ